PARSDDAVDQLIAKARQRASDAGADVEITAAAEGEAINLHGQQEPKFSPFMPSSLVNPASDLLKELILIAGVSDEERAILVEAADADSIPSVTVSIDKVEEAIASGHPSLIFLGD